MVWEYGKAASLDDPRAGRKNRGRNQYNPDEIRTAPELGIHGQRTPQHGDIYDDATQQMHSSANQQKSEALPTMDMGRSGPINLTSGGQDAWTIIHEATHRLTGTLNYQYGSRDMEMEEEVRNAELDDLMPESAAEREGGHARQARPWGPLDVQRRERRLQPPAELVRHGAARSDERGLLRPVHPDGDGAPGATLLTACPATVGPPV